MRVWNVLHADRWKYRIKNYAKKSPSAHHRTTLAISSQLRHVSTIRKKLVKQQYLIGERRPTNSWDLFGSLGQISMSFSSWLCYCTDVLQWKSTELCMIFCSLLVCNEKLMLFELCCKCSEEMICQLLTERESCFEASTSWVHKLC